MKNAKLTKKQRAAMTVKLTTYFAERLETPYEVILYLKWTDEKKEQAMFYIEDGYLERLYDTCKTTGMTVVVYSHYPMKSYRELTGKELNGFDRTYFRVGII